MPTHPHAREANPARPGGVIPDRAALKPEVQPPRPNLPANTFSDPDAVVKAAISAVGVMHGCRLTDTVARIIIADVEGAFPWIPAATVSAIMLDPHRKGMLIDNILTCDLAQLVALAATEGSWVAR
ncbi:MAG: hypothetical protein V4537_14400 [Pseudomonadota bacterium]